MSENNGYKLINQLSFVLNSIILKCKQKISVSVDFHREILKHIFEKRTLLNECKKTHNSDANSIP